MTSTSGFLTSWWSKWHLVGISTSLYAWWLLGQSMIALKPWETVRYNYLPYFFPAEPICLTTVVQRSQQYLSHTATVQLRLEGGQTSSAVLE